MKFSFFLRVYHYFLPSELETKKNEEEFWFQSTEKDVFLTRSIVCDGDSDVRIYSEEITRYLPRYFRRRRLRFSLFRINSFFIPTAKHRRNRHCLHFGREECVIEH